MVSFGSQKCVTYKKHVVYCRSKFCRETEDTLFQCCQIVINAKIISAHFVFLHASKVKMAQVQIW